MLNFLRKRLDTQSKTLFKNSSWVFFSNVVGAGLTFIRGIIIVRGLGAELFGIYTIIVAFIATVMEVLNLNLVTPIIRYGAQYKADNRPDKIVALIKLGLLATFIISLLSVLIVTVLTFVTYDTFIKAPNLEWFSISYSVAASILLFNHISRGALRLYFKFKVNSIIQVYMDIAELVLVALALLIFPKQLEYFLIAILFSRLINGIVPAVAAFKELLPEFKDHLHSPINLLKDQYKTIRIFVINNSLARTIQSLINNGDVLLIGVLSSNPAQAAFYAVGKKLAWTVLTLTDPFSNSVYPQFCKLYSENQSGEIKKMVVKLTLLAAIPAVIFMLVAYFFNEFIITLLFGKQYLGAATTFSLLTGASLLYAMFFWIQPLLQALDLVSSRLYVSIMGLLIGVVSAYILIPKYGSNGMAVTMILINIVMPGFFITFAFRKVRYQIQV
ncbi:MAG TPA: oligosaccharide flippase family protein [Bacteroidia bacterium]|nr:oligosaccharide flippase family protein [Bacteroidia bacterium]